MPCSLWGSCFIFLSTAKRRKTVKECSTETGNNYLTVQTIHTVAGMGLYTRYNKPRVLGLIRTTANAAKPGSTVSRNPDSTLGRQDLKPSVRKHNLARQLLALQKQKNINGTVMASNEEFIGSSLPCMTNIYIDPSSFVSHTVLCGNACQYLSVELILFGWWIILITTVSNDGQLQDACQL